MPADGSLGQVKYIPDFLVTQALRDQLRDLNLSRRSEWVCGGWAGVCRSS